MSILGPIKAVTIVCTRDRERAKPFFRDVLELKLVSEDDFAAVFDIGGTQMRLSTVADWTAHNHTVLGFVVQDIKASVTALTAKGVVFNIYEGFGQDAQGIWTAPGGDVRVAWFNDPDGNVLSLTQF